MVRFVGGGGGGGGSGWEPMEGLFDTSVEASGGVGQANEVSPAMLVPSLLSNGSPSPAPPLSLGNALNSSVFDFFLQIR